MLSITHPKPTWWIITISLKYLNEFWRPISKTRKYARMAWGQFAFKKWILLSFRYLNIFCMKRLTYPNLSITENECHIITTNHYLWLKMIASEVKDLSSDMKSVLTVYWCLAFVVHIHFHFYIFLKSALDSSEQKWLHCLRFLSL